MISKIKKTILSFAIAFTPLLAAGSVVVSPIAAADDTASTNKCASNTFFPSWYEGLCDESTGNIKSPNDMGASDTSGNLGKWITTIALNLVTILLYVVGYVSLGFIIYGGFKYMTSGDSSSGTQAARKTITNAVIGLVLSIMSVAIVKFVAGAIVR